MASRLRKVVIYDCVARHHIVARCPYCDSGVLLVTCPDDFKGMLESPCSDCAESVALYVLLKDKKVWLLAEPLQVTTPHPSKKGGELEA